MPRKPLGARPLTQAERQAHARERRAWEREQMVEALSHMVEALSSIRHADYVTEARQIAEEALARLSRPQPPRGV